MSPLKTLKKSVTSFISNVTSPKATRHPPKGHSPPAAPFPSAAVSNVATRRSPEKNSPHRNWNHGAEQMARMQTQQNSTQMSTQLAHQGRCDLCAARLAGGSSVITSCGHSFHQKCLQEYVKQLISRNVNNLRCPVCMLPLNAMLNSPEGKPTGAQKEKREGRHIEMTFGLRILQSRARGGEVHRADAFARPRQIIQVRRARGGEGASPSCRAPQGDDANGDKNSKH